MTQLTGWIGNIALFETMESAREFAAQHGTWAGMLNGKMQTSATTPSVQLDKATADALKAGTQ